MPTCHLATRHLCDDDSHARFPLCGSLSIDLKVLNFAVGGTIKYSNTTIFIHSSFAMLLLGMVLAYRQIARRASDERLERLKAFSDNVVKLIVLIAYLLYPSLSQRVLLLYQYACTATTTLFLMQYQCPCAARTGLCVPGLSSSWFISRPRPTPFRVHEQAAIFW